MRLRLSFSQKQKQYLSSSAHGTVTSQKGHGAVIDNDIKLERECFDFS